MKIVVTTPTGHIGSKLAKLLLDRGADLTVIARHPEKVEALAHRGAKVIEGEHDDPAVLEKAVATADALFFVIPPALTSPDPLGHARRFADTAGTVIAKHPELRVIQISSVGAHLRSGTGPILGLHYTEEKFRAVAKNFVALRPNYFMENVFNSLHTIVTDGNIYTTVPGSTSAPQIATQDIAEVAADVLLAPASGQRIIDIVGPEALSYDRVAQVLGEAIAKPVRVITIPSDAMKMGAVQAGLSSAMADLLVEMEGSFASGMPNELRGDEKRTGKVIFQQFVTNAFLPAYNAQTAMQAAR
jgi:uncharacterized protein YbjT (DUF2867 family)